MTPVTAAEVNVVLSVMHAMNAQPDKIIILKAGTVFITWSIFH